MIYFIASRADEQEFVIISCTPSIPLYFHTLDQAKYFFQPYYDIFSKEAVNGPVFRTHIGNLQHAAPVIIGIDQDEVGKAVNVLMKLIYDCAPRQPNIKIIGSPHVYLKMKNGFIAKHQQLDIIEYIQSIKRVNASGQLEMVQLNYHRLKPGESARQQEFTEGMARDILKRHGLQ